MLLLLCVVVVVIVNKTKKSVNLLAPPATDKGWISRDRKLCEAGSASFVNTASAQKVAADEVGEHPAPTSCECAQLVLVPQHIHCSHDTVYMLTVMFSPLSKNC